MFRGTICVGTAQRPHSINTLPGSALQALRSRTASSRGCRRAALTRPPGRAYAACSKAGADRSRPSPWC